MSRFHPAHRMLDVEPTPVATLLRAAAIGRAAGLAHVYVGNAPELRLEDTRCAGCGGVVIERSGYRTLSHLTADGRCRVVRTAARRDRARTRAPSGGRR